MIYVVESVFKETLFLFSGPFANKIRADETVFLWFLHVHAFLVVPVIKYLIVKLILQNI